MADVDLHLHAVLRGAPVPSPSVVSGGNRREGLYRFEMAPDVKCLQSNPLPTDRSIRHHQHTPIRSASDQQWLMVKQLHSPAPAPPSPAVIKNNRNCLI